MQCRQKIIKHKRGNGTKACQNSASLPAKTKTPQENVTYGTSAEDKFN